MVFSIQFSINGLRKETEAVNSTTLTVLGHAYNANHTSRLYKCACANIEVDVSMKLQRKISIVWQEKNVQT